MCVAVRADRTSPTHHAASVSSGHRAVYRSPAQPRSGAASDEVAATLHCLATCIRHPTILCAITVAWVADHSFSVITAVSPLINQWLGRDSNATFLVVPALPKGALVEAQAVAATAMPIFMSGTSVVLLDTQPLQRSESSLVESLHRF